MGIWELVILLAIFMLLFGAKRLPDLADGMGKAIKNFKRGLNNPEEDVTPPQKQMSEASSAQDIQDAETRAVEPKS